AIAAGLSRIDAADREMFQKNAEDFKKRLAAKTAEWKSLSAPARGIKAVSHHPDMIYLADFMGLHLAGTVELKAGIPATPRHLEELVQKMKAEKVPLIVREIQYDANEAKWLAEQTGARIAPIATMGGAFPDS